MFKLASLVFFWVVSHTAFALSNSESISNHYLNSISANSLLANNEYSSETRVKTISQGRYIGGGVASIFLGFGIGHAIQGRWKERGWIHTTTQSIALIAVVTSLIIMNKDIEKKIQEGMENKLEKIKFTNTPLDFATVIFVGVITGLESFDSIWFKTSVAIGYVLGGLKGWEMIDVWLLPDSIKIISQKNNFHKSSPLKHKTKIPYSVALSWQF